MTAYTITVRFDRLGTGTGPKLKRPDQDVQTVEVQSHHGGPLEVDVAATVSDLARKVVPGLHGLQLDVRLTTPDGGPWSSAYFFVEDAHTGRRHGHGLVAVAETATGHPWHLNPWAPPPPGALPCTTRENRNRQ